MKEDKWYDDGMIFWLCLAAPLVFLANALVLGAMEPGYSAKSDAISSLVRTGQSHWQTANFIVCGVLVLYLAYMLMGVHHSSLRNGHLVWWGALVLGGSLVLLGIFPTDVTGTTTVVGQIHGVIFVGSVLAQVGLQIALAASNMPSSTSIYLFASGAITALGLPAMMVFPDWRGVAQRVLVAAILLWVTVGAYIVRK